MQQLPPGFQLDDAPPQRAPGIIEGPPRRIDPAEERRLAIAEDAAARAAQKDAREENRQEQGFDATESERKAGAFLIRALGANAAFNKSGQGARALPQQMLRDAFPNFENYLIPGERQVADSAQDEFIAASLRQDSGAAIPPEELERQRRIYFPMPGDGPEVIQQKAEARLRAILGLEQSAGRLAEGSRQRFEQMAQQFLDQTQPEQASRRDERPEGVRLRMDSLGEDDPFDRSRYLQEQFGIEPGAETRLVGMINANIGNPNLSPEMLSNIYAMAGVPPPSPEDMQTMLSEMKEGRRPATGIDTSRAREEYEAGLGQVLEQEGVDPNSTADSALFGVARGMTFGFSDEITGLGNAVGAALTGGDPGLAYTTSRDAVRLMEQRSKEQSPYSAYGSEIGGAVLTGGALMAPAKSVGQAARIGAIEGGVAGAGSARDLQSVPGNALLGAGIGAGAGAGLQAVGSGVASALRARRAARLTENASEVAEAGERLGVTTRRADVDTGLREARGRVQQTTEGRQALDSAFKSDLEEMEAALISNLGGSTTSRTQGGQAIQEGVKGAIDSTRARASRLYEVASREAGDIQIDPRRALDVIDGQIEELAANGANRNAARIKHLRETRQDITRRGGLTITGLRALRTDLRSDLKNAGIYTSDFERRMGMVLDAVSEDIAAGLRGNPKAAARYAEADKLWRQQAETREQIGDMLLGRTGTKGPGAAAAQVLTWAKSDPGRLSRLMAEAGPETQSEVRALIAGQLGRQSNGNFQLGAFLRETSEGSGGKITPAAMRAVFGEDGVRAIKDLRTLAQAKTDAANATNYSNTGSSIQAAAGSFRRLLLGGLGFSAASSAGTGVGALASGGAVIGGELLRKMGDARTIRLLLDPTFTNALKRAPNTAKPEAIDLWFSRLRKAGSRNPNFITDLEALQRSLIEVANDNTSRLAATEGDTDQPR